jgi:hypothetical protein
MLQRLTLSLLFRLESGGPRRAPMLERLTLSLLFRLESGGPRRQQCVSLCVLRDLL